MLSAFLLPASAGFLLGLKKECWVLSELHDVTIQKTVLFVVTAMKTSNAISEKDFFGLNCWQ
jgi:hypothetical protein